MQADAISTVAQAIDYISKTPEGRAHCSAIWLHRLTFFISSQPIKRLDSGK